MLVAWVSMVEFTEAPLVPVRLVQARVALEGAPVVLEEDAAQGAVEEAVGEAVDAAVAADVVVVDAVEADPGINLPYVLFPSSSGV
jgi:hypothetical protein